MDNVVTNVYSMTRKEYYISQGLSGSEIDRPDDLVDDDFIQHVQSLKGIMNSFIQQAKQGAKFIQLDTK